MLAYTQYFHTWMLEYKDTWILEYEYFCIWMSDLVFFWNFFNASRPALADTCIIANNAHKNKNIHDLKMTENEMCHADNEYNNVETHD